MTSHQPYARVTVTNPDGSYAMAIPPSPVRSPMVSGHPPPGANGSFTSIPASMVNAGFLQTTPGRFAAKRDDERSVSSSGASSTSHDAQLLPLCTDDAACQRVNDKEHQKQFSHTCRLFPCFHAHLKYHTRFFRHAPGQAATTSSEEGSEGSQNASNASTGSLSRTRAAKHRKQARKALTSVSFTHISPDVPGAQKIVVLQGTRAFEIAGDWSNVMLHTFKRYLYQVTGVRPAAQILQMGQLKLDDEAALLSDLGVAEGSQIIVDVDVTKVNAPAPVPVADAAASPKIPLAWL